MMPAGMEVDAGPVPIGFEHGEPEGGFAGAEDPPDQSLPVLDAPKTVVVSPDIELVRWMMVRKQKICAYAVHCAPGSVSKSETSARVKRSPGQNQKQHSEQEAFEACPEPVISSRLSAVPTRRPRLGAAVQ
jgi:hypothetical protein